MFSYVLDLFMLLEKKSNKEQFLRPSNVQNKEQQLNVRHLNIYCHSHVSLLNFVFLLLPTS
jgi:hypothetical protein